MPFSKGFGESNGYPSGSLSDNTTKDTSTVPIIKSDIVQSETPNKATSSVPKEL